MMQWRAIPRILALALGGAVLSATPALAQVTPAAGHTPPDDTPSVKVGVTIFSDYTFTDEPTVLDSDGNKIHPSAFNISRAYINVTGNLSHNVSFRVTPDISRLATTTTATLDPNESVKVATSLDGSLAFRLKYAFGQLNLDDRWSKGSWVRFGVQQTPYIDWNEGIYRYRFQGTIFVDREGFLSSSDFGLSTHYSLPGGYGDVHGGYYNGETFAKAETSDQKAIQIRGTLRPLPNSGILKGLKLTAFYDADSYFQGDARRRAIGAVTFEHKYVNAGAEYLSAADQPLAAAPLVKAEGYSVWATPRSTKGWEGLLRYDNLKPNKDVDATKTRRIAGVAYWFHTQQAGGAAAVLLDYESVAYDAALGKPEEKRYAIHTLFNF
jgi:hypothetical protein